jgi:hypothetical protein
MRIMCKGQAWNCEAPGFFTGPSESVSPTAPIAPRPGPGPRGRGPGVALPI